MKNSNIDEAFNTNLNEVYMNLEAEIFSLTKKDKEYIEEININLIDETFKNFLKDNYNMPDETLNKIMAEFQTFKETMYDYMAYFVKKSFKIGFNSSIELLLRNCENANKN